MKAIAFTSAAGEQERDKKQNDNEWFKAAEIAGIRAYANSSSLRGRVYKRYPYEDAKEQKECYGSEGIAGFSHDFFRRGAERLF